MSFPLTKGFIFVRFTFSSLDFRLCFHVQNFFYNSSTHSARRTKSSVYRSSHGQLILLFCHGLLVS
uniref:Uncharacterized protein n=1 Tax=Octopus bimaculoides TaxID=37653 RepID=A0A0L8GM82_OCTBM